MSKKLIGHIVSGSLSEGLVMRVASGVDVKELKAGKFVSIQTQIHEQFFSLLTDLKLEVTNPDILLFPPLDEEKTVQNFLTKKDIYVTAILRPILSLIQSKTKPVKTIPSHFAPVYEVSRKDVADIFGDEHDSTKQFFNIGTPIDMEDAPVCINLDKLTERSTGIFGKTGTGKTFLTRLLLAGLIKNNKAVTLIFDMHSEYGLQARKESSNESFVKGLKTLFANKVSIFSLDPESTRRRGGMPDVVIELNYQSVSVEDILALQEELNLHPTAYEAAHLIAAKYKRDWLSVLLKQGETLKEFAQEIGAHPESVAALYRKLRQIEKLPFFRPDMAGNEEQDVFTKMMDYINNGISITIEFGNFTSTFCYLLIANIITRRLHNLYMQKTEKFLGSHLPQDEPKKLVIVIEEAHKFLNSQAAKQTIFGTIAREMRKYYVSLLVVDQRPSGIDDEIISQLGTKVIAQLNDERDIQAVLTGVGNASQLRAILASLESKKQVLLLGHAIAMPIVIEARSYDEAFYKAIGSNQNHNADKLIKDIF